MQNFNSKPKQYLLISSIFSILLIPFQLHADEGDTKRFEFNNPNKTWSKEGQQLRQLNNGCSFPNLNLPDNVVVYAAGGYAGKPTNMQIDQSGHEAGIMDVAVNSPTNPVLLMLGAYDPTIWNIGWTPNTRILAVFVSGYHKQVIAGLPKTTPRLLSTYDNKGACGYMYINESGRNAINPKSRMLFNRNVNMVYVADKGSVLVGNDLSDNDILTTSTDTPVSSFNDKSAPLAGKAGLNEAVRLGLIRPATKEDAMKWIAAEESAARSRDVNQDVPPQVGGHSPSEISYYNGYVVLKPFTFPAGLYGANSGTFFVLKGVEFPKGNPGHSTVYDYNRMICTGARPMCSEKDTAEPRKRR